MLSEFLDHGVFIHHQGILRWAEGQNSGGKSRHKRRLWTCWRPNSLLYLQALLSWR